MANHLVSVILPVYNAEEYLDRCIQSILNQKYKTIELIIINDGSTDNSEEICKYYANTDPRVQYFTQKNSGPSVARNKGLQLAKGHFIQFIDSDDYLEKDSIGSLVMNSRNAQLVIAGYKNIYSKEENYKTSITKFNKVGLFKKSEFLEHFGDILQKQLFHYTWHKLYLKEIATRVAFKEELKIGEDLLFNLEYVKYIDNIRIVDDPVYNHILYNQTSITKRYHDSLFLTRKLLHQSLVTFLIDNNKFNGDNKKAVEELYTDRIISCFSNIIMSSSSLSFSQKKKEVMLIVNDETVREIIERFNFSSKFTKRVYGKLINNRNYNMILCFSYLLLFINRLRSKG